jgi:hypothetical protein
MKYKVIIQKRILAAIKNELKSCIEPFSTWDEFIKRANSSMKKLTKKRIIDFHYLVQSKENEPDFVLCYKRPEAAGGEWATFSFSIS